MKDKTNDCISMQGENYMFTQADKKGHGKRTRGTAWGGFIGGGIGSFLGPVGGVVGAGLGALIGSAWGEEADKQAHR